MFDTKPPDPDQPPNQNERSKRVARWMREYEIEFGEYLGAGCVTVTVAGATFCDRAEDFPSEALFANVAFAVHTGNVTARDPYKGPWARGKK